MEDAIVVCSLQRPRPGVVAASPPTTGSAPVAAKGVPPEQRVHPSIQGMVRIVATSDDAPDTEAGGDAPTHALHTALVATGVRADAAFLLARLQAHVAGYWFRYDALPASAAKMAQDVLWDCLGYDRGAEATGSGVSGGIGSAAGDGDGDDGSARAGRPLGVCVLLLGMGAGPAGTPPALTLVRADGTAREYVARAMGAGATLGNEKMSQRWRRGMHREEAREMLCGILKDISREEGWAPLEDGGDDGGLAVACETVTPKGIEVEYLPL
jgi:hypothetical protein